MHEGDSFATLHGERSGGSRTWLLCLLPLLWLGCQAPVDPLVATCADVAQHYHGLPNNVTVLDGTLQIEDGSVVFGYEVINTRNQPQEGTAACRFTDDGTLTEALVDGVALRGDRLDALLD
ncbi:MAG: hypothetical protein AAFN13_14315 [Bacteroidota bacterium]